MRKVRIGNDGKLSIVGELIEDGLTTKLFNTGDIKTGELIEGVSFQLLNNKVKAFEFIEGANSDVAFTPLSIPNCTLWADAENIEGTNGQAVNTLPEIVSGNNFTGYGTLNTVGVKSIVFRGSSMATLNNVGIDGNSPRTIIVLGKPYSGGNIFGYGVEGDSLMVDGLLYSSVFSIHAHGGGYDNIDVAPQFSINQIQAFSIVYDGTQVKTGVNRNISPYIGMRLWTQSAQFIIGMGVYGGYNSFNGEIMEVLIYDKALDDTELNTIMDYLGNKRGLSL